MAAHSELSCLVCCDIYKDPVVLTCGHSLCRACLQRFWKDRRSGKCPLCRSQQSKFPPCNFALRDQCDALLKRGDPQSASGGPCRADPEVRCSLHGKKRKLFCLDDNEPVCYVCRDSKKHKSHNFSPIDEASLDLKRELKTKLDAFQKKLSAFKEAKDQFEKSVKHLKTQVQDSEKQIKQEFEKLHRFLRDEEAMRIAAVRQEEDQKSQMMKQKIEKMNSEISFLSNSIRDIEEKMAADDATFLQSYNSTRIKAHYPLQDPEKVSGALLDVAKHLGNLKFNVWTKMQVILYYTPVILDPNTAKANLVLSEDLTGVRRGDQKKQLPDNPERFDWAPTVLGSEGFRSGTRGWDVEVGDSEFWNVGVMTESLHRKGNNWITTSGQWFVVYQDGKYWAQSPPQPSTVVAVKEKLQRVRIQLDWGRGRVSFSDPADNTHLHTFKHVFSEGVFPFFNSARPLRVLPVKVSVRVEEHT